METTLTLTMKLFAVGIAGGSATWLVLAGIELLARWMEKKHPRWT